MENPAEVQEIRDKLRMMDFPQGEILNTVRRQQRSIHRQKTANDTLRNEINEYKAQIASAQQAITSHDANEDLLHLQSLEKSLANKKSVLNNDCSAEEQKLKILEEEVSKARSKVGGMFGQSRENEELQARLRTMENRLDKSLVRYNENLSDLSDLREQLDEVRKDRFNFRDVIKGAKTESEQRDQKIAGLISESNDAYSERDRMKMELAQVKNAEKEDIANYDHEISRLNQTLEGQKIAQGHPHDSQPSVPSISSQVGSTTDQTDELTTQTDTFQAEITKTLELLQMKDVDQLFAEAGKLEKENFSLFKCVVEQGANKTKLQEEISALEMQVKALGAQAQSKDEKQAGEVSELTKKISDTEAELAGIEDRKKKSEAENTEIYTEIEGLHNLLGCSWDNSPDEKKNITPKNALFVLASIEAEMTTLTSKIGQRAMDLFNSQSNEKKLPIVDEKSEKAPHAKVVEREVTGKQVDANRPLSIDEMRSLIA